LRKVEGAPETPPLDLSQATFNHLAPYGWIGMSVSSKPVVYAQPRW
jgi:hypothetical protein